MYTLDWKQCNLCEKFKPLEEFDKNSYKHTGRDERCRDCKKKQTNARRARQVANGERRKKARIAGSVRESEIIEGNFIKAELNQGQSESARIEPVSPFGGSETAELGSGTDS